MGKTPQLLDATLTTRPANEVGWEELQELFGSSTAPRLCQCQRYKPVSYTHLTLPTNREV